MPTRRVQKKSGSLVVTIPSQMAERWGIVKDTEMTVTDGPDGSITYKKVNADGKQE